MLDEDWLVLSTMHSAKGLEFDVVYVIHAADGNIPSDMATGTPEQVDEERRLFYVACTRARDHLYVTHPLRYYTPAARSLGHARLRAAHAIRLRARAAALRRGAGVTGLRNRRRGAAEDDERGRAGQHRRLWG